jgi:hypothetical protein
MSMSMVAVKTSEVRGTLGPCKEITNERIRNYRKLFCLMQNNIMATTQNLYSCMRAGTKTKLKKINYMEKRPPWEAYSCSASQEIPCLLWNPKVHYRVHDGTPPDETIHILLNYFPNIIILSTPRSSQRSQPFRFYNRNSLRISHRHACYMPYPPHLLDLIILKANTS